MSFPPPHVLTKTLGPLSFTRHQTLKEFVVTDNFTPHCNHVCNNFVTGFPSHVESEGVALVLCIYVFVRWLGDEGIETASVGRGRETVSFVSHSLFGGHDLFPPPHSRGQWNSSDLYDDVIMM